MDGNKLIIHNNTAAKLEISFDKPPTSSFLEGVSNVQLADSIEHSGHSDSIMHRSKIEKKGVSSKPLFLTIDRKLALRRRQFGLKSTSIENDPNDGDIDAKQSSSSAENSSESQKAIGHAKVRTSPTLIGTGTGASLGQHKNHIQMADIVRRVLVALFMAIFISAVQLYTWLTLPIYFFLQRPWENRAKTNRCHIKELPVPKNVQNLVKRSPEEEEEEQLMSSVYIRNEKFEKTHEIFKLNNLTDMLEKCVSWLGSDTPALGYRKVLAEEDSLDEQGKARRIDGRQLKRYRLGEYQWLNYSQVNTLSKRIAQGLMNKGIVDTDKVLILSETRFEWMVSAQAIIRTGAAVVTLFSNLGLDGVSHGIAETEVNTIITSIDCLNLLKQVLNRKEHVVKRIIYLNGFQTPDLSGFSDSIEILSLDEIEDIGKAVIEVGGAKPFYQADPDHLMIIMYTSGTTGSPKAALMSHRQFVASLNALFVLVKDIIQEAPNNCYISYLPMAHVLELTGGVKIGYASPFTLTDSAPGLAKGEKSDIKLLRPTVITAVPLVLDRILKEVNEKLRSRTPVSEPVFKFLMSYKSKWTRRGFTCNIVRNLLCQKVKEQLGGNLSFMIVGGAPLNGNTQATIKSALDLTLIQGYGATETTGAVLCMDLDDLEYGRVGSPLGNVKLRLKDWPEGGYFSKDKPNPRGELLIGGDIVALGYYKLPRQTEESFFVDSNGVRWFRTGDIGELYPNGTIKIIDRRKDLIKLQNGEYISLGKVEAALKSCQFVDNICVYGGTFSSDVVALLSPNRKALDELVLKLEKKFTSIHQMCQDDEIEQVVYTELVKTAKAANLGKKEIPLRIKLVAEEWSPDNGILTAALKLKRKTIESHYKKELYELYNEKKIKVVVSNNYDQNNNNTIGGDKLSFDNSVHQNGVNKSS